MNEHLIKIESISTLPQKTKEFLHVTSGKKQFAFYGEMGVGKTTFIKSLLDEMGIEDHSSSPTFSIVNEYFSVNYGKIYHFDFYRIKDEMEAYDIGVEEIFEEDAYLFIEWPEKIENLLPENCVKISIAVENNCRIIRFQL